MKIYALYQDDGPTGIVPQSCNNTCPYFQLHIFDSQYKFEDWKQSVLKGSSRRKPRIVFVLEDFEDSMEVFHHYELETDLKKDFLDLILLFNKCIKKTPQSVDNLEEILDNYIKKYINKE